MATMISEVYDALLEAGASEEKARKAAEAVAAYDQRFAAVETRMVELGGVYSARAVDGGHQHCAHARGPLEAPQALTHIVSDSCGYSVVHRVGWGLYACASGSPRRPEKAGQERTAGAHQKSLRVDFLRWHSAKPLQGRAGSPGGAAGQGENTGV